MMQPNPEPSRSGDENLGDLRSAGASSIDTELLLRREDLQLYGCFTRFCDENKSQEVGAGENRAADQNESWLCAGAVVEVGKHLKGELERDAISGDALSVAPANALVLGGRCLTLVRPALDDASGGAPENVMPLSFAGWNDSYLAYLTPTRCTERFRALARVGVIAEVDLHSRESTVYPVYTERSWDVSLMRLQAIGLKVAELRRSNPTAGAREVEASALLAGLCKAIVDAEALPPPGDPELVAWKVRGLSRLTVPDHGGECDIGFLRYSERRDSLVEEVHRVALERSDLGMLEPTYLGCQHYDVRRH